MTKSFLIDTHVLIWYSVKPQLLPALVQTVMRKQENTIIVSAITAWELSIKVRLGKLPEAESLYQNYHQRLAQYGFIELGLNSVHALQEGEIKHEHKDPFDRALAAQAISEQLPFITGDLVFTEFADVSVMWTS